MKRTLAIARKVLKELFRDKRALAMMLVAPILVMFLLNVAFNTNSTTDVMVATVGVSSKVKANLDDVSHVTVKKYHSKSAAKKALQDENVAAVIEQTSTNHYVITYANTDAAQTALTKAAFQTALTKTATQQMKSTLATLSGKVKTLSQTVANLKAASQETTGTSTTTLPTTASSSSSTPTNSSVKITNHYQYGDKNTGYFAKMLPILVGFFVFFFVFLISGMALLKERSTGTLDRLLATPVRRSEIVFGYMLSYAFFAIIQTAVIVGAAVWMLGMEVAGSLWFVFLINFVFALVALVFGLLMSTLATSEFQLMQFIPIVIMPQVFFSGIIDLAAMPSWVQAFSKILPLTYAGDALSGIILHGWDFSKIAVDLGILLVFLVVLLAANVIGLKRYRKV